MADAVNDPLVFEQVGAGLRIGAAPQASLCAAASNVMAIKKKAPTRGKVDLGEEIFMAIRIFR